MNEVRICGMLGFAMRAGKLVLGTDAICDKMAKRGALSLVAVSRDASAATKKKLTVKAEFYRIPTIILPIDMDRLGELLGKTYSPAAVGIADPGFAGEIIKAAEQ